MENPKAQALQRIKEANNVLVTVSANPSVDQLAGAIGLTLLLNKLGKHATAVFSGSPPSTIEFLKPEDTLEKTTDSLRDFIIALDKSKADKLRYKVEDQHVKIFITPYRTSIGQDDLEFSQGDFNVDVVVALGVHEQKDIDRAITAHGRILHDATVISVNTTGTVELGNISWIDEKASSLCEMLFAMGEGLKSDVFDTQMSTAFLTGIVAETERFSNKKTTSITMAISAKLMAAGANQQLVATKLQAPNPQEVKNNTAVEEVKDPANQVKVAQNNQDKPAQNDGSLTVEHGINLDAADILNPENPISRIHIDDQGGLHKLDNNTPQDSTAEPSESNGEDASNSEAVPKTPRLVEKPPMLGGRLTANTEPEGSETPSDPLIQSNDEAPLLSHDVPSLENTLKKVSSSDEDIPQLPSPGDSEANTINPLKDESDQKTPDSGDEKQEDANPAERNPQQEVQNTPPLDNLRHAVDQAASSGPDNTLPQPNLAVGSTPMDIDLGHGETPGNPSQDPVINSDSKQYLDVAKIDANTGLPSSLVPPNSGLPADNTAADANPTAPPPVPPPMVPRYNVF